MKKIINNTKKIDNPVLRKQSFKFLLTINNPLEKGYTHSAINDILLKNFKTLTYHCMVDEKAQTFHTHIFVCFTSRVRFSTIKRYFPEAHIDVPQGTVSNNVDYIKKAGKWSGTAKAQTQIEGSFEEHGIQPPDSKGKRNDMSELLQMIKAGMTNSQIIAENQDYILILDKIDKLRTTLLVDECRGDIRTDLQVVYISGATGTGKTSGIYAKHGYADVYRVTDYQHPFDSYECQTIISFDEFRSSLKLSDMLNYCDIYPQVLPARYANKFACYNTVYIVSNWTLEQQYEDVQKTNPASWDAFLRRIHEVWVYTELGKEPVKYPSVKDYMNRIHDFQKIPENGSTPFHS